MAAFEKIQAKTPLSEMEEKVIRNFFDVGVDEKGYLLPVTSRLSFKHLWLRLLNTKYVHTKPVHGAMCIK